MLTNPSGCRFPRRYGPPAGVEGPMGGNGLMNLEVLIEFNVNDKSIPIISVEKINVNKRFPLASIVA